MKLINFKQFLPGEKPLVRTLAGMDWDVFSDPTRNALDFQGTSMLLLVHVASEALDHFITLSVFLPDKVLERNKSFKTESRRCEF